MRTIVELPVIRVFHLTNLLCKHPENDEGPKNRICDEHTFHQKIKEILASPNQTQEPKNRSRRENENDSSIH
jgi:hypothetical protein